ncbi:MAG: hypothetical protein JNK45_36535 [Myxococcales bacterium]|nr:hypothetical protein [Myxococcales bacterium]
MRKKKLILTKETVKNLTLGDEELGAVVGGAGGVSISVNPGTTVMYTTTANTGATCHSCGASCLACPGTGNFTSVINPQP